MSSLVLGGLFGGRSMVRSRVVGLSRGVRLGCSDLRSDHLLLRHGHAAHLHHAHLGNAHHRHVGGGRLHEVRVRAWSQLSEVLSIK